jgi:hypothetical protein
MASLIAAARSWVDQIHLNASSPGERAGLAVWTKRRRFAAGVMMRMANLFFRLARNPVEAIANAGEWRRWEIECFARLHGPEFPSGCDANGTVWVAVLPGECLSSHLAAGTLTAEMMSAAARELRRVHGLACPRYGGAWSHGDPHSGNFLYDAVAGRARLIDFEVRHSRSLGADERHADDLLVLLQDVCGRSGADAWLPLAVAFLDSYDRPEIVARVAKKLRVPRGIPRLWWAVRTSWMPRAELERRLAKLRGRIGDSRSAGQRLYTTA